ncbi:SymE family type I addiction module toxin [uncultured Chryseobacterium sp.]|uniref:SymE family type I addiction module toxin n=1 Tax=uncultured Chryseobacterium sp. TaxID=259322 RepID=UPI0025EBB949|nr:SymE family type I addiction module toxin [uncultured Chryseobacterium sp.]
MKQEKKFHHKKDRHLKVYGKYTGNSNPWRPNILPEIRLCGKWLQEIGFEQGNTIKVQQRKNKITITLDPQEKN